ncbi:MAG: hypothetical protein ACFB8W_25495 [Elainellaceae cyanobacterium]
MAIAPDPMSHNIAVLQAAGSHKIGVGHLSRTAALAAALQRSGLWQRVVLLWETAPDLANRFAPAGCEVILVEDAASASRERSHLILPSETAVLITDMLDLTVQDVQEARSQGFGAIAHLNDSGTGRFAVDLLVDEDGFKSETDLPPNFQGVGLVGNAYRIIRESIRQCRPPAPWRGDRIEKILITLGGADPANLTLDLVQRLYDAPGQLPFAVTVVIGPAFDPQQVTELRAIAQTTDGVTLLDSPPCLGRAIVEHDLTITLGGITSYEAMCLGRPCAAISWSFMATYVERLSQAELLENLGTLPQAAHRLLEVIQNVAKLQRLAHKGWLAVDGYGAERIADRIGEWAIAGLSKPFSQLPRPGKF